MAGPLAAPLSPEGSGTASCAIGCLGWWQSAQATGDTGLSMARSCISSAMLRVRGNRSSLLAALLAHWSEQQLAIPAACLSSRCSDRRAKAAKDSA
jgi:hypothetical protein